MTIEDRLDNLERQVGRYRKMTVALALVLVAGVSMGQTEDYQDLTVRSLKVVNKAGIIVAQLEPSEHGGWLATYSNVGRMLVALSVSSNGDGFFTTFSSEGKELVSIGSTTAGDGTLNTYSSTGKELVQLGVATTGDGVLYTFSSVGKELVKLGVTPDGGAIEVFNKTGESVILVRTDEYSNGRIGVYNREGKGRVYDSQ